MPASPPALDYAPYPTARRRWMRRLRRVWPVALLLIVASLSIAYGPGVWRRWQVIKLQEACMTAELPTDRPMWEWEPVAAKALVAARPGEYELNSDGFAVRTDSRWAALASVLGVRAWVDVPSGSARVTLFCHERHTPDGRRRLVTVEGWRYCTVIDPVAWSGGDGPRVVWQEKLGYAPAITDAIDASGGLSGPSRFMAGVPDPVDPTRFSALFVTRGVPATFEYRLGNDDRVTMRLLDPEGFIARATAAKARAATQPAP